MHWKFIRILPLWSVLLLVSSVLSSRAFADETQEAAYRAHPRAELAEKIAKHYLEKGALAAGVNWAERTVRSPGATTAHQNWLSKLHQDSRWALSDQGYGLLNVSVRPAHAIVVIDGSELWPIGPNHAIWLKEGSYTVDAAAADHAAVSQVVSTARGEKRSVDLQLKITRPPVLHLHVRPEAEVRLDGVYVGLSSKGKFVVAIGTHLLELREKGYKNWLHEITLVAGEDKVLQINMEPVQEAEVSTHKASVVERPILATETEEAADGHRFQGAPKGSPLDKKMGRKDGSQAPPGDAPKPGPAAEQSPEQTAQVEAKPEEVVSAPDTPPAESTPGKAWSNGAKGGIYGAIGLISLGAGAYLTLNAVQTVNGLNATATPAKTYSADYAAAQQASFVGYGTMGLGVAGLGLGSYYLFARDGLSRRGKGIALTGVGAVVAGGAAYWMLLAIAEADAANKLQFNDRDYAVRYDAASNNHLIGIGIAAAGGLIAASGLYLALTGGGSSAQNHAVPADAPSTQLATWSVLPWVSAEVSGALLSARW